MNRDRIAFVIVGALALVVWTCASWPKKGHALETVQVVVEENRHAETSSTARHFEEKRSDLDRLIGALIIVESNGDDFAIGDRNLQNKAYGCLQIRQPCVDDVNMILGSDYLAEDCLGDRELSIKICKAYLAKWATEQRLGRKPTLEDMARIWNGGPRGYTKPSTERYYKEVNKILNNQH